MAEKKKPTKKAMGRGLGAFFDDIEENVVPEEAKKSQGRQGPLHRL